MRKNFQLYKNNTVVSYLTIFFYVSCRGHPNFAIQNRRGWLGTRLQNPQCGILNPRLEFFYMGRIPASHEQWIPSRDSYYISSAPFLEFDLNVFKAILSIQRFFNMTEYWEVETQNSLLFRHARMQIWIWHLKQRSAAKGFVFQQLRCHCNPDQSKFSSLFNTDSWSGSLRHRRN